LGFGSRELEGPKASRPKKLSAKELKTIRAQSLASLSQVPRSLKQTLFRSRNLQEKREGRAKLPLGIDKVD
jgi:hypothetical protein